MGQGNNKKEKLRTNVMKAIWGVRGAMVTVVGNGYGYTSSNAGRFFSYSTNSLVEGMHSNIPYR